jgi:hypothetical protein
VKGPTSSPDTVDENWHIQLLGMKGAFPFLSRMVLELHIDIITYGNSLSQHLVTWEPSSIAYGNLALNRYLISVATCQHIFCIWWVDEWGVLCHLLV